MRSGEITLGGKTYPVKGLSVRQSLTEDKAAADSGDYVTSRIRRVALALQNGAAFIPDPKNPNGQFKASDRSIEDVMAAIEADGVVADMEEWYAAELVVIALNSKPKEVIPIKPGEVKEKTEGEALATE